MYRFTGEEEIKNQYIVENSLAKLHELYIEAERQVGF
jgi:hypothetical protein